MNKSRSYGLNKIMVLPQNQFVPFDVRTYPDAPAEVRPVYPIRNRQSRFNAIHSTFKSVCPTCGDKFARVSDSGNIYEGFYTFTHDDDVTNKCHASKQWVDSIMTDIKSIATIAWMDDPILSLVGKCLVCGYRTEKAKYRHSEKYLDIYSPVHKIIYIFQHVAPFTDCLSSYCAISKEDLDKLK